MNKDIKKLHVNYEVMCSAILQLSHEQQIAINAKVAVTLGLPLDATSAQIERKRQVMIDALDAYDDILDVFEMLKKVTGELDNALDGSDNGATESYEALAEAQMLIGSINHEQK